VLRRAASQARQVIGLRRQHARVVRGIDAGRSGARRRHLFQGDFERRARILDRTPRMRHVFARDHLFGRQRRAPRQVFACAGQGDAALFDHGEELLDVRIALALLAHGRPQARLGLGQRDLGVGRIEAHDFRAGLHLLGFVGADLDHAAGDLRGHRDQVAADIGVVGLDALRQDQRGIGAVGKAPRAKTPVMPSRTALRLFGFGVVSVIVVFSVVGSLPVRRRSVAPGRGSRRRAP
jgi:hypothetical protein